MQAELERLRAGEISFDTFARRTSQDWTRLAARLYKGWRRKLPTEITVDDIRQEMLLHAWVAVGKFDPSRGVTIQKYVVYCACAYATRAIHKARVAYRNDSKSPSRHAVPFSQLGLTDDYLMAIAGQSVVVDVEAWLDGRRAFERALERATSASQRDALNMLLATRGDVVKAGAELYAAIPSRERIRNQICERDTRTFVMRTLRACAGDEHEQAQAN